MIYIAMEELKSSIKQLNDDSLRCELHKAGIQAGPILSSTRLLLENKLINVKARENGLSPHEDHSKIEENSNKENISPAKQKTDVSLNGEEATEARAAVYYGVSLPTDADLTEFEVKEAVFTDKTEALKFAKKFKGARFKVFKNESDARQFSQQAADLAQSPAAKQPILLQGSPDTLIGVSSTGAATESLPFKGPKTQDLVQLRRAIESNDKEKFTNLVWSNPRYLISGGDTPVLLQEGCRYNGLHVCAMRNKPDMCRLLLDTVEDPKFIELLYTNDSEETRNSRMDFLVDLYLNTPDKGNCETPLHFACKFGHVEIVEILTSHPKTLKNMKNKYGELPVDVLCSRMKDQSKTDETRRRVEELLEDHYFVPLLRSADNTVPPSIGEPWSPDHTDFTHCPGTPERGGCSSPRDPQLEVKAYAGPMLPNQAEVFRRKWCTPSSGGRKKYFQIKRSDGEKGMERIGRDLALELGVPWTEYWKFLNKNVNISSPEGLKMLEDYLSQKSQQIPDDVEILMELTNEMSLNDSAAALWSPVGCSSVKRDGKFVNKSTRQDLDGISVNLFLNKERPCKENDVIDGDADGGTTKRMLNDSADFERALNSMTDKFSRINLDLSSSSNHSGGFSPKHSDKVSPSLKYNADSSSDLKSSSLDTRDKCLILEEKQGKEGRIKDSTREGDFIDKSSKTNRDEETPVTRPSKISSLFGALWSVASYIPLPGFLRRRPGPTSPTTGKEMDEARNVFKEKKPQDEEEEEEEEESDLDRSDNSDCSDSYNSARSVFIHGAHPTKEDVDVYWALQNTVIKKAEFPHVLKWRKLVESFDDSVKNRWPTPSRRGRKLDILSQSAPAAAFAAGLTSSPNRNYMRADLNFSSPQLPSRNSSFQEEN